MVTNWALLSPGGGWWWWASLSAHQAHQDLHQVMTSTSSTFTRWWLWWWWADEKPRQGLACGPRLARLAQRVDEGILRPWENCWKWSPSHHLCVLVHKIVTRTVYCVCVCNAQVHSVLRGPPCTSHWKWSHEGFPGLPHTPYSSYSYSCLACYTNPCR